MNEQSPEGLVPVIRMPLDAVSPIDRHPGSSEKVVVLPSTTMQYCGHVEDGAFSSSIPVRFSASHLQSLIHPMSLR
jgi:hypothetical protein